MDDSATACVGLAFVLLLALAIYFLPMIVLLLRHKKHLYSGHMYGEMFVFNLLENWLVIPWFVFLWGAFKEKADDKTLARRRKRRYG